MTSKKEKCERCGKQAVDTAACHKCKDFHSLCADCLDLYFFTFTGLRTCFLEE